MYASLASAPQVLVLEIKLVLTAAAPETVLVLVLMAQGLLSRATPPEKSRRALLASCACTRTLRELRVTFIESWCML